MLSLPKAKIPPKDKINMIVDAMLRRVSPLPRFNNEIVAYCDHDGNKIFYKIENNQIKFVSDSNMELEIDTYWNIVARKIPEFYRPEHSDLVKVRKMLLIKAPTIGGSIPSLLLNNDPRPAFQKFERTYPTECPDTWKRLIAKSSSPDLLMLFIGSLLDPTSDNSQYLWIKGDGGEGKGSFVRGILSALGQAGSVEQPPASEKRFWTQGLRHKRFVCFMDLDDVNFVTTGLFKTISGNDPIRFEIKKGATYTAEIDAKFCIVSNYLPNLSHNNADARRVILVEFKDNDDYIENFEEKLKAEAIDFISYCYDKFKLTGNKKIEFKKEEDKELYNQAVVLGDSNIFNEIFYDNFVENHNKHVEARHITKIMNDNNMSQSVRRQFKAYLYKKGIKYQTIRVDGETTVKGYKGMMLRLF
jgi:hypothetical protein